MSEIKHIYTGWINIRLDIAEEISTFEDKAIDVTPNETQTGKNETELKMSRASVSPGTTSNDQIYMYLEFPQNWGGWHKINI